MDGTIRIPSCLYRLSVKRISPCIDDKTFIETRNELICRAISVV